AIKQYLALYQLEQLQLKNCNELYFEKESVILKLNDYEIFSLIDESTSFNAKHLLIVAKYFINNKLVLQYLRIIELTNCNAKSITKDLERFIIAKSLNIKNIFYFRSDIQNTLEELELVLLNIVSTCWLLFSNIIYNFYRSLKLVKEVLLEEAITNQQAVSLLTDIDQEFEIIIINEVLPTYSPNLYEYIANNNLNIDQLLIFISEFILAIIESLNNHFSNRELFNVLKIFDSEQLQI
ncbi:7768_t:CDS:2, partial [Scutellospora calospora]